MEVFFSQAHKATHSSSMTTPSRATGAGRGCPVLQTCSHSAVQVPGRMQEALYSQPQSLPSDDVVALQNFRDPVASRSHQNICTSAGGRPVDRRAENSNESYLSAVTACGQRMLCSSQLHWWFPILSPVPLLVDTPSEKLRAVVRRK